MWNRAELKDRAKGVLRRVYWAAVAVCLIAGIFAGDFNASSGNGDGEEYSVTVPYTDGTVRVGSHISNPLARTAVSVAAGLVGLAVLTMGVLAAIIGLTVRFLVGTPMEVGRNRFFLKARRERAQIGELFFGFRDGHYGHILLIMFLRSLKVFLWSLLLVIPGIIKSYEYCMVPYILAENPDLDSASVFALSRSMMDGQKMEAFVLDLSFLLWDLLGSITLGIADVLWVTPYKAATKAELYAALREEALQRGTALPHELPGV